MIPFIVTASALVLGASLMAASPLWRQARTAGTLRTAGWPAAAILALLAALTAGVYPLVGTPQALRGPIPVAQPEVPPAPTAEDAPAEDSGPGPTPAQIEAMVTRLAQRLQNQPDDLAGWRMLARSYETLGRFDAAVQAYQQLLQRQTPDADLLTDYAVVLGMARGRTLVGEPEAVIRQALTLNPRHVQALALSGSASFEKRDYQRAIATWGQLLSLVPPDDGVRASIEANIRKAEALAAQNRSGTTVPR